jgi:hypothetical protein
MYELHFAVPMVGVVLCTLNTRRESAMVSILLKHFGAKVFFIESHLLDVGRAARKLLTELHLLDDSAQHDHEHAGRGPKASA